MPHKDPEVARAYYLATKERRRVTKSAWYALNRERNIALATQWKKDNKERDNARRRANYAADPTMVRDTAYAWRDANPEMFAYSKHKQDAKKRGVPFFFTFDEWWAVWRDSGKWEQRGVRKGQYVMARFGDKGGYETSNVRICTSSENGSERNRVNPLPSKRGPYKKRRHG